MKLIKNLFQNKLLLFCIIAPSLGAIIYVFILDVYIRLYAAEQVHSPAWKMIFLAFLSLIVGFPFIPPAFATLIFNETSFVKKNKSLLFKIMITAIFGGATSLIYIVCLAREAEPDFYAHIFFIGMFCAGLVTYISEKHARKKL